MSKATRISQLTDDIGANRVPGGSAFARAAAELITLRANAVPEAAGVDEVRRTVSEVSHWVADTKPSMAVVRNVAELAQAVVLESNATDAAALKSVVDDTMRAFMSRSQDAIAAIARHSAGLFAEGSTVLIHSYSASLEGMLCAATLNGTKFRLLVTESRPYRESRRLIEAVADSAVEVVLYSDAGVCIAAEDADIALIGADSVFTDGSFANKTGSLPLALACQRSDVPLYVATELAKLYFGDIDDIGMELRPAEELSEGWELITSGRVEVRNQFFERVDAQFVHRYVTEAGLLSAREMHAAAARSWKTVPTNEIAL